MSNNLCLGKDIDTKKKVFISQKTRSTHMQVIGSTGTGKSKFLEWMIRKDISEGNGLCLIDPHGYLYDDVVNWLASNKIFFQNKKIVLFNPANDDYFLGFNPFINHSIDISHQVDTMVNACAKVWGAESMDTTPLLKKCLRSIFFALAESDLTLIESLYFISLSENSKKLRRYLIDKINNPVIKEIWESFDNLRPREYNEQFSSSANRLIEFLTSERIRRIIGQRNGINFKTMMDDGYVVLINLSSGQRLSRDNARLLGTLLVNDLFLSATERKRDRGRPPKPFYLYIDECAQFLNEDIGRILDECRKFGLHLILAHQHLSQLKKAGEDIYGSVMTDAKTKVIFGGLMPEDTEILAKQIFMGEFDIDEIKRKIYRTTVVGYHREWFSSVSDTIGSSDSDSNMSGSGTGTGRGSGASYLYTNDDDQLNYSTNESVSSISSEFSASGSSHTKSESHSSGQSEALIPELKKELGSIQFRNLDEQLYRAMALMTNQPQAHCLVKIPNQDVKVLKVPHVNEAPARYNRQKDIPLEYQIENFQKYKGQFISLKEIVDKGIKERHTILLEKAINEAEEKEKEEKGSVEDLRE